MMMHEIALPDSGYSPYVELDAEELDDMAYKAYINPNSKMCQFFGVCTSEKSATTDFCDEHEVIMFG